MDGRGRTWLAVCMLASLALHSRGQECGDRRIKVEFGYDMISSCSLSAEFDSCDSIREAVADYQRHLLPADGVHQIHSINSSLVPIIKTEEISDFPENETMEEICLDVPTRFEMVVLYSPADEGYTIVALNSLLKSENVVLGEKIFLTSSVVFREAVEKSNVSRFWREVISPAGSSSSWMTLALIIFPSLRVGHLPPSTILLLPILLVLIFLLSKLH